MLLTGTSRTETTIRFFILALIIVTLYNLISYLIVSGYFRQGRKQVNHASKHPSEVTAVCTTVDKSLWRKVYKPKQFEMLPTNLKYTNVLLLVTNSNFLDASRLVAAMHLTVSSSSGGKPVSPFHVAIYGVALSSESIRQIHMWLNTTYIQLPVAEIVNKNADDLQWFENNMKSILDSVSTQTAVHFPGMQFVNSEPTIAAILKLYPNVEQNYQLLLNRETSFFPPDAHTDEKVVALPLKHKRFAILVMIAFEESYNRALDTLTTWERYPMCTDRYPTVDTDLIFSIGKEQSKEYEVKLLRSIQSSFPCLDRIYFTYPKDDDEESLKSLAGHMFVNLSYRYWFVVHTEVEPIRANWLQRLIDLSFDDPSIFWTKGSIYRGETVNTKFIEGNININKNAIHALTNDYRQFLSKMFLVSKGSKDVDVFIFKYMLRKLPDMRLMYHYFKPDDYIQHLWDTKYKIHHLQALYPNTYFAIGK